jgi:uncharacterized protein YkwD
LPATANAEQAARTLRPLEQGLLTSVNALRRQHDLVPLQLSSSLTAAARAHSNDMASRGYFSHRSAGGLSFAQRIARFYPMNGSYWSVGENLLWSSSHLSAAAALKMWLASPKHRENLLRTRWREIGFGAVRVASAPGPYGGREVTIVTADFGVRR